MKFRLYGIVLLLLWLLVSCAKPLPQPIVTPTQPPTKTAVTGEEPAVPVLTPTALPTSTPHRQTPAPTPTSASGNLPSGKGGGYGVAPVPGSLMELEGEQPASSGNTAGFLNQYAIADQFVLSLSAIPQLPNDQAYQGWLIANDGAALSLGILQLAADGKIAFSWTSPSGENLLSRYGRFEITLEPTAGSPSPAGRVAYAGGLDASRLDMARQLFVKNTRQPPTPLNTPLLAGLLSQLELVIQHVHNAENAAAIGAQGEMRLHLEHMINILEGAEGERFKDYTGDGAAQNPGDGFGVRGYARQIAALLGGESQLVSGEVESQISVTQDQCVAIFQLTDLAQIKVQLIDLRAMAETLKNGPITRLNQLVWDIVQFQVESLP